MDISFVTRKFQRSIAGLGLATILATSVFTGTAFGMSFDDVASDYFAADQIDALSDAGIMTGYEGTDNFGISDALTREQAAKILVLAFNVGVDADATVTCEGPYSAWAESYLATANLYGILEGDNEGNCNANDDVKRAEFAKMTVSAAALSSDGTMASDWFDDVEAGSWYDSYMGTAYVYGIMSGYANGDMGPADSVTRGQAAKMTYNAMYPVYNPPSTGDDDDDDDDDDVVTGGGALEVILSSDSAEDYTYFSAGTNAEVANFEVTASDEDVLVTSFDVELASGDTDSILALALYNAEGTRISKVDTSIDSDDVARMTMLNGGYTVAAGTSENFRLMNTFDTIAGGANTSTLYSYAFDSSMIESNAGTVEVENDLVTGIFGLLDNNTGELTVTLDEAPSDVQVGETDAVIASFEMEETSGDKDVWLWAVTLENNGTANLEDAVDELALYFDGDWVADGTQNGDYVSFQMDEETAPMIEAGNREAFEVRARIISESGETLNFSLEEELDVLATDEDDNNVAIISTFDYYGADDFTIDAGAVSVVAYDAESDKFRADRDDVELGRFEVTAGTDGLTLNTVNLDVTVTDGANDPTRVSDLFENFTVSVNGSNNSMDLDGAAGLTETYTVDTDKTLTEGTVYEFVVYADSFSIDELDENIATFVDYTDYTIEIALENLGTGATTDGLVIEEDASGDQVTDFSPSAVSFNQLDGETAGVEISGHALSSAKDAVVGSDDVLALEFEVEESADVSDLTIKDLDVALHYDSTAGDPYEAADNTVISSVDLYQVNADDTETLLDSVSGSNLGATNDDDGTTVNFDFSDVTVAQNATETFRVYVSIVDDAALDADTVAVRVMSYDIRDDENNSVYDAGDDDVQDGSFDGDNNGDRDPLDVGEEPRPTSGRTITFVATGILYVNVDNTDDTYGTESPRWLLAGETGVGLMTIEVRAENEDVVMEEYTLTSDAEDNLSLYFSTIYIYDEDGVLVGSKNLSSEVNTVTFDSTSTELTAYAGETATYYFVADLLAYGEAFAGAVDSATVAPEESFQFSTDVVTGVDSNDTFTAGDDDGLEEAGEVVMEGEDGIDGDVEYTAASEYWSVVATRISNVKFVTSAPTGETVETVLTGGENLVAILAVTVDDTDNTQADGTDIEAILAEVNVNMFFDFEGAVLPSDVRMDLLGTSSTADATDTAPDATGVLVEFLLDGQFADEDLEIDPGETIYLGIYATASLAGATDGEFIQVKVDDINAGWLDWNDSAVGTTRDSVYMGTTTTLTATKVSEAN